MPPHMSDTPGFIVFAVTLAEFVNTASVFITLVVDSALVVILLYVFADIEFELSNRHGSVMVTTKDCYWSTILIAFRLSVSTVVKNRV